MYTCVSYPLLTLFPDTFLTRDVVFIASSDEVCITCTFMDGVDAANCYVNLTNEDDGNSFYLEISYQGPLISSTGCISGLLKGIYQLQVYDLEYDGNIVPEPVFVFKNVTIIGSGEILKDKLTLYARCTQSRC